MLSERSVKGTATVADISSLVERYPYCSSFQVLSAIALKETDSIDAKAQLNIASIYIQDRENLYEYIVRDSLLKTVESVTTNSVVEDNIKVHEVEPILTEAVEDEPISVEHSEMEPTSDEKPKPEAPLIPSNPMEEEILREAVVHLGELEAGYMLEELAEQPEIEVLEPETSEPPSSFGAWLLNLDHDKTSTKKEAVSQSLIDKFIQESPQISPVKTAFFSPTQMGKMSLIEDESFVTETLAKIYERQGDYKKAASAYGNLKLKYPEKSVYFANLQKQAEEKSNKLK